jgi:hypothetical protein
MVLSLPAPTTIAIRRVAQWTPNVLTWLLLAMFIAAIGWSYFSNPKPGPYGMCYTGNGRALTSHDCGAPPAKRR